MKNELKNKINEFMIFYRDNRISIIGVLALVVVISCWSFTYFNLKDMDSGERGTIGDMFGTVNALFSGLAFAGIIVTILMQREELKSQREELALTRKEFHSQNKTMKLQRFENTFFNLLKHLDLTISHFDLEIRPDTSAHAAMHGGIPVSKTTIFTGRNVFHSDYYELLQDVRVRKISYQDYFLKRKKDYGHYFSLLESILELINSSDFFSEEDARNFHQRQNEHSTFNNDYRDYLIELKNHETRLIYASFLKSQLSYYEKQMIFFRVLCGRTSHVLGSPSTSRFKYLIEKYSIFDGMEADDFPGVDTMYKETAFNKLLYGIELTDQFDKNS